MNAVHPGGVRTRLSRAYWGLGTIWKWFPLLRSPRKGAETSVYLATSPEVEGVTGKYFVNKKESRSAPASRNLRLRRKLWKVSAELTGLDV